MGRVYRESRIQKAWGYKSSIGHLKWLCGRKRLGELDGMGPVADYCKAGILCSHHMRDAPPIEFGIAFHVPSCAVSMKPTAPS